MYLIAAIETSQVDHSALSRIYELEKVAPQWAQRKGPPSPEQSAAAVQGGGWPQLTTAVFCRHPQPALALELSAKSKDGSETGQKAGNTGTEKVAILMSNSRSFPRRNSTHHDLALEQAR